MARDDQQDSFERTLTATLTRVIDFLKFAETKNAALLTFSSAWIIGSVNFLTGARGLSYCWTLTFMLALPLFVVAALIALASFLPLTALRKFHKDPEQPKSLLYFGDAASFALAAFKERFRQRYYPPEGASFTANYLDDISIQIAVNSQITLRKLRFFHVGAVCAGFALLVMLLQASFDIVELAKDAHLTAED